MQRPTPNPSGATGSSLSGVSCTTTTACTAVGAGSTGGGNPPPDLALAVAWDGSAWSIQPIPSLGAGYDTVFRGVSCTSASACTAVGYDYINQGPEDAPLAEGWNGSAWAVETVSAPTGSAAPKLSSVSCSTATNCVAVGSSDLSDPLAEHWNGTSWTIQPTPQAAP